MPSVEGPAADIRRALGINGWGTDIMRLKRRLGLALQLQNEHDAQIAMLSVQVRELQRIARVDALRKMGTNPLIETLPKVDE